MFRVAAEKSGVAAAANPAAVSPARLFGLDAGDWSMMFFGLVAVALLLALV
jgi:hypothetical protein